MAGKGGVKDVGRVLNVPLEPVNRLTAMVPKVLNIPLEDSLKQSTDLRREYETDADVRRLIDIAMKLEGNNRNVGTHAAGVVIANGNITDFVPVQRVQRRESGEGEPILTTQWGMGDLEKVGLLKMDFLGLRTLTVVDNTLKLIEKARGIKLDIESVDEKDAKTYQLLQRGDARGVFQLESDGIRELLRGAQERGGSEGTAREIFDLICFFGGYGFNKSHSAAYAKLGFQTAYLKTHSTAEFMAALLSSEIDDSNKRDIMVEHIEDARRLGAPVHPPNIQEGAANFTVNDGQIVFGLLAINGVGRGPADSIVRARADKRPFRDFYDFCERADHRAMPRSALERLIKAGAFDCMGARRRQLMEAMPRAISAVEQAQNDRRIGQLNLFESLNGDSGDDAPRDDLPDVPEWPTVEKLKHEKESLDFYITSHPLTQYRDVIERFAAHRVEALGSCDQNQEVFLGGILTQVRYQNT